MELMCQNYWEKLISGNPTFGADFLGEAINSFENRSSLRISFLGN
jgi:hypothetical protein